jgi:CspA family cold shock protein
MATGTVKFFNSQKGFGFIVQDGGGPDVFVHISAVERAGMSNLNEGQKLSFDVQADPRSGKSAAANLQAVKANTTGETPRLRGVFSFCI